MEETRIRANRRLLACIGVAILLMSTLPLVSPFSFRFSSAQIAPAVPGFIELGYGTSSLASASNGVPIFTSHDNLWVLSDLPQQLTLTLFSPAGGRIVVDQLTTSTARLVYRFGGNDPPGNWTLEADLQNGSSYKILVPFILTSRTPASARLSEYSIQSGEIDLGFGITPSPAFNMEGCLATGPENDTVFVPVPTSLGGGEVAITTPANTSSSVVTIQTKPLQPFSLSYGFDYSYSYSSAVPNGTISRAVTALKSVTTVFSTNSTQRVPVEAETSLRPGRYVLNALFDSSSGPTIIASRVLLLTNGTWRWIDNCNPFRVSSLSFSRQVGLTQDPRTWPNILYLMYNLEGVDSYSVTPLQINLDRVDFLGQPGSVPLSYLNYKISNNTALQASGVYQGSIYLIVRNYPISITITPLLGEVQLTPRSVLISQPFADTTLSIPVGTLNVEVLNNSRPDPGSQIAISTNTGFDMVSNVGSTGNASFFLPSGTYNITASKGQASMLENGTVVQGESTLVVFRFANPSLLQSNYFELVAVPLIIGIFLNIWIWVVRPRTSKWRI